MAEYPVTRASNSVSLTYFYEGVIVMSIKLTDQQMAEQQIERCLYCLRSSDPSSVFSRNKWRKSIENELFFLKEEHPDSYILQEDISDISLELE